MSEMLVMAERCATCAYRDGTVASKSQLTLLKAKMCMLAGEPFLCHEDPNGVGLCAGWVKAMEVRQEKGIGVETVEWRRLIYLEASELICRYEDALEAGNPFDMDAEILAMVQRVGKTLDGSAA